MPEPEDESRYLLLRGHRQYAEFRGKRVAAGEQGPGFSTMRFDHALVAVRLCVGLLELAWHSV
ncbi:hypothetical protein [Kribbella sp. NPDC050459]|uniref:hypothetical protein n=1 Tax=Kribbella sp. NPDC050459 TaxID=3155785 RepID=UPI0034076FF8